MAVAEVQRDVVYAVKLTAHPGGFSNKAAKYAKIYLLMVSVYLG